MIERIVDWAWASSLPIEPVASIQKQTSINPNAGIGKWSFDLVLKIVFLIYPGRVGTEGAEGAIVDFLGDVFEGASFLSVFDVEA